MKIPESTPEPWFLQIQGLRQPRQQTWIAAAEHYRCRKPDLGLGEEAGALEAVHPAHEGGGLQQQVGDAHVAGRVEDLADQAHQVAGLLAGRPVPAAQHRLPSTWGLGFWGLGFRIRAGVWGLGFGVWGLAASDIVRAQVAQTGAVQQRSAGSFDRGV